MNEVKTLVENIIKGIQEKKGQGIAIADLRDIDGIRKWYITSLKGMSDLLDIIKQTA